METLPDDLLSQLMTNPTTAENIPTGDTTPFSIDIMPTPAFCLKTKLLDSNDKVFINVCTTDDMKKPRDVTDEELIKIIQTQDASQFRVPLSLGNLAQNLIDLITRVLSMTSYYTLVCMRSL